MKIGKYIKSHDLFGHEVKLNFNKTGSTYNTVVGGLVSIVIKCLIYVYVIFLFKRMILHEKDHKENVETRVEYDELGEVAWSHINANIMLQIFDTRTL